ncbi:unnamed protein product, partial [Urochloa humidicola]
WAGAGRWQDVAARVEVNHAAGERGIWYDDLLHHLLYRRRLRQRQICAQVPSVKT